MNNLRLDAIPSFLSDMKVDSFDGDLSGFKGIIKTDAMGGNLRLDTQGQIFFARQLELIKAGSWDVMYRELKADMLLPVDTEGDLWTTSITYRVFSKVGHAKILSDYATDIPRVDILGEEKTANVKTIGSMYGYNIFEIARAQKTGINLSTKRAQTSVEANMERLDKAAWFGSPSDGLQGFFNYPGILTYVVPAGTGGDTEWDTKTSEEIKEDVFGAVRLVKTTTFGRKVVNQILLPIDQNELISRKQNSTASDITVKEYILKALPGVEIAELDELAGYADGADMGMAYVKDVRNVAQRRPVPMKTMPTEYKNMEYTVAQISRTGGVVVYYPQSVVKFPGI